MADNEGATSSEDQDKLDPATGGDPAEDLDPFEGVGTEDDDKTPDTLKEGGQRFNQVWARMQRAEANSTEARTANAQLQERIRNLESTTPQTPPVTTEGIARFTENDLKVAIDSGNSGEVARIMAGISKQEAQDESRKQARRSTASTRHASQVEHATTEIREYIRIAPSIATKDHPRWNEVEKAYYDDTSNLGAPADARTELRALRTVFGPVDRFRARVEATKRTPDHHIEVGAAGGMNLAPPVEPPTANNPFEERPKVTDLSQVPERYINHWKMRGMDNDNMLKEANFLRPSQLSRK